MSFAEWELVLSSGNQQAADTVWNAIKDKAVKLGANVISATATRFSWPAATTISRPRRPISR